LTWSDCLALAAKAHCDDIGASGATSHTGSDGSSYKDRMVRYGTPGGTTAENIAFSAAEGDYMMD